MKFRKFIILEILYHDWSIMIRYIKSPEKVYPISTGFGFDSAISWTEVVPEGSDTYEINKKGKVITLKYCCYKLIDRMICGRYRISARHVDLEKACHLEAQEVYKADEDEHEAVDNVIDKMQLDEYQRKVLTHRMAGLSMSEIGRLLSRSAGAIGSVIYTIQRRYKRYIQL